ncbi:MAG: hypothetical protein WC254_04200 [Candidatus Woesearchaeota archaeon]|jgi:hypothetical protein
MNHPLKQRLAKYIYNTLTSRTDDSLEFLTIYSTLTKATRPSFVQSVAQMQNPVVIDIASFYGEEFGLWIAKQNPTAEVHVYNPFTFDYFAPFLFNRLNEGIIAKLSPTTEFETAHPEASINRLYRTNGIRNITFHKHAVSQPGLEAIAEQYSPREVVFVSLRTPTTPREMTSQIAGAVAKHPHRHMILAPYINDDIRTYHDDPLIRHINDNWRRLLLNKQFERQDLTESKDARLYIAFSLYYALCSAEKTGATIYQNALPQGFSFQYPCFFVSTLPPQQHGL